MKHANLNDFGNSWFIGNFHPSLKPTKHFEMGFKEYPRETSCDRHKHKLADEINLIVAGTGTFLFFHETKLDKPYKIIEVQKGDVLIVEKNEIVQLVSKDGISIVVAKTPSVQEDKYVY